jgi:hypothetical protein
MHPELGWAQGTGKDWGIYVKKKKKCHQSSLAHNTFLAIRARIQKHNKGK